MKTFAKVGALALAALALVVCLRPTPGGATSLVIHERIFYALTADNRLMTFDVHTPGKIDRTVTLTGLQQGESMLAIDVRPSGGTLYGLGSTSRLYTINPATGVVTAVGSEAFTPALSGTEFGFDFDPATDTARVVSDTGQNLRVNPSTGAATADAPLAYAAGDPRAGRNPHIVGLDYVTSSFGGEQPSTALYGIDTNLDVIVRFDDPNGGVLRTVGTLGHDFSEALGFASAPGGGLPFALAKRPSDREPVVFLLHLSPNFPADSARGEAIAALGTRAPLRGFAVAPTSGTFRFSQEQYRVVEDLTSVAITVVRDGDTSRAASVDYAVRCEPNALVACEADRSASSLSDFSNAIGTLRFAPGETQKSFNVLVNEDSIVESGDGKEGETVTFSLFNTTGNFATGTPRVATLLIVDDDAPGLAANAIDDAQNFVHQHYHDFLGREPDAQGLAHWTSQMTGCGSADPIVCRINVSAAFFLSIEFKETGYFVYRMHHAAFATGERLRLQDFTRDVASVSEGVVVGADGWAGRVEANKLSLADGFVQRPEFLTRYPASMAAGEFVTALDANAGGVVSAQERDELAAGLASGALTRAQVLRAVAEDADLAAREKNRAFVLMQYFGYLRRNPDDVGFDGQPDPNFLGYAFWLSKLNEFNGNFVQAEMVRAFIESIEYRQRFGR